MTRIAPLPLALIALLFLDACGRDEAAPAAREAPGERASPAAEALPPAPELEELGDFEPEPGAEAAMPPDPPAPSWPRDVPLPEDSRVLDHLPADVPVPEDATPLHPPLVSGEFTHASYELAGTVASTQAYYMSRLLGQGWSIPPSKVSQSEGTILARKGDRELSVMLAEVEGRTHVVIIETRADSR